ncbi:hypothetical protein [Methanobrevibacter sp.]|uniref:hypothetical protein n=1 Tax=Methanobrevibacter sp. TaxID=66852 RepID=UPI0038903F9E
MGSFSIFKLYFDDFKNDNESFLKGKDTRDAIKFMEAFPQKNSKVEGMFLRSIFGC